MKTETRKTILLVEDEVIIALVEKQQLTEMGYSIIHVLNGVKAIAKIRSGDEPIDLILMDIDLGSGIDGTQAAQQILEIKDIPIVFLSSHTEPEIVEKTEKITSYGYVVKNTGITVLGASLKMAFKLFEAKMQTQDVFNHSINGMCLLRMLYDETGKEIDCVFLQVNKAFEKHTGLSDATLLGKTIRELFPENEADKLLEMYSATISTGVPLKKELYIASLKSWFEQSVFSTKSNDQFAVVLQNITERKLTEEKLHEKDIQFRKLSANVYDMIYQFTRRPDGTYFVPIASDGIRNIFGCSPEDVLSDFTPIARVIHPEDLNRIIQEIEFSAKHLTHFLTEYRVQVPGKKMQLVFSRSTPERLPDGNVTWYGFSADITEHKETEKKFRHNKEILNMIINTIPQSVFWKDTVGRYLGCNSVFAKAVGIQDPDEIVGKTDYDMPWPKDEADAYRADDQQVLQTASAKMHITEPLQQIDGSRLWVDTSKMPLFDDTGKPFVVLGIYDDITDQIKAKKNLQISEDRYRRLVTNLEAGIVVHASDTSIIMNNSKAEEILGLSEAQMKGKTAIDPAWKFVDEKSIPLDPDQYPVNRIVNSKNSIKNQIYGIFQPNKSETVWVTVNGFPVCDDQGDLAEVIISFIDITERKQAEEALRLSEEKYKSYTENAPDAIFISDENGRYIEVNNAAGLITGYSREELLHMSIPDMLIPESLEPGLAHFNRLREFGASQGEIKFKHKNGSTRWWSVDAVRLTSNRFLGFAKEITQRKQAEEDIKRQLSEKETLLKEVHHRIKNNISSIEGLLYMQADSSINPEVKSALLDAISRVQGMRILYDKLSSGKNFQEVSVKNYTESLIKSIIAVFPEMNKVSYEVQIDDFEISTKMMIPIGIIINELLTNIFKYAFNSIISGHVSISLKKTPNKINIIIQDNGIGLSKDFDLNNSPGFGLTIVRMLTESLGGTYAIESGSGTKSVLEFDLEI